MFTKDIPVTITANMREKLAKVLEDTKYSHFVGDEQARVDKFIALLRTNDNRLCKDGGWEHMCSFDDDGVGTCVYCDVRINPEGEIID